MNKACTLLLLLTGGLVFAQDSVPELPAPARPAPPAFPALPSPDAAASPVIPGLRAPAAAKEAKGERLKFFGTSLALVLEDISERTGKVILRDPAVPEIQINLVSEDPLPLEEYLNAIESLLSMNNIALVPFRDDFIKVLPSAGVQRDGAPLILDPDEEQPEQDQVISQLITLKYLDTTEVQGLIAERLSETSNVQLVERANSLLVTGTRANIARVRRILEVIDQPAEVREGVKIYQLLNATASEVKARLEELIQESQQNLANQNINRNRNNNRNRNTPVTPRGVIRPNAANQGGGGGGSVSDDVGPAPGLIRGQVQIVADERTNILLIISRSENDPFFEEMIAALDEKVDPEITVRIFNLQFADAAEASETLNELIGAATESDEGPEVDRGNNRGGNSRSGQSVREFVNRNQRTSTPSAATNEGGIGSLASNTRILADERTNSLILMGRNQDLDVLEGVIRELDKMLAQVAVRAVVMEVILNDNISYGIDWLQRSMIASNVENVNGVPVSEEVFSFGGGQSLGASPAGFIDGANVTRNTALNAGGLTYFTTFYDFNIDAVLTLAQSSSDAKVVATPIIVTTDNTEASISVGERRAIPTTTATTIGGSVQSSFDYENIGLDLAVTPRINPQGMVIMEVTQTAENVGGTTTIDGNEVPIITSRELEASVSIRSGGTLALGGLVREDNRDVESKVPLLGDIPFLGALFRSTSKETVRTELIVLLSPEVLVSSEEAEALTRRLRNATELKGQQWRDGWGLPFVEGEEVPEGGRIEPAE